MARGKTRRGFGLRPERIGEYWIERHIGETPTTALYEAVHRVLPRRAIVKVMLEPVDPPVQLLREAIILDALHHPGIARVYEAGLLPDRRAWFSYELVEGTTTASLLAPESFDRIGTVSLLRDLAEVLDYAHSRGVVHGGLHPERIVLTSITRGFPLCINDWSEVRTYDATPVAYIPTPASWHYSSPELAAGEPINDRSDVFSLGVIGYQLLTGQLPSRVQIATDEHQPSFISAEERCPDAPIELTRLVDQMLSYMPDERPSCAEIHEDLVFLAHALGSPEAASFRIRKPKWTPPLDFDQPPDDAPEHTHTRAKRTDEDG
jgi:eukaryotic-like serine/threonine-protein kinase